MEFIVCDPGYPKPDKGPGQPCVQDLKTRIYKLISNSYLETTHQKICGQMNEKGKATHPFTTRMIAFPTVEKMKAIMARNRDPFAGPAGLRKLT